MTSKSQTTMSTNLINIIESHGGLRNALEYYLGIGNYHYSRILLSQYNPMDVHKMFVELAHYCKGDILTLFVETLDYRLNIHSVEGLMYVDDKTLYDIITFPKIQISITDKMVKYICKLVDEGNLERFKIFMNIKVLQMNIQIIRKVFSERHDSFARIMIGINGMIRSYLRNRDDLEYHDFIKLEFEKDVILTKHKMFVENIKTTIEAEAAGYLEVIFPYLSKYNKSKLNYFI